MMHRTPKYERSASMKALNVISLAIMFVFVSLFSACGGGENGGGGVDTGEQYTVTSDPGTTASGVEGCVLHLPNARDPIYSTYGGLLAGTSLQEMQTRIQDALTDPESGLPFITGRLAEGQRITNAQILQFLVSASGEETSIDVHVAESCTELESDVDLQAEAATRLELNVKSESDCDTDYTCACSCVGDGCDACDGCGDGCCC
jgi:hypothetical protein